MAAPALRHASPAFCAAAFEAFTALDKPDVSAAVSAEMATLSSAIVKAMVFVEQAGLAVAMLIVTG
jgi:hypothetical protein